MLESPSVEIDFFRLSESSPKKELSDRRDIQGVISKINPKLLKTAIASASANKGFLANKSCPSPQQAQTLPAYTKDCGNVNMPKGGSPLTIFYNGIVSVLDVSSEQAEKIMKLAESASSGSETSESSMAITQQNINKDLPMSRKKSLRRFLEKRKERQVAKSPYAYSQGNASLQ